MRWDKSWKKYALLQELTSQNMTKNLAFDSWCSRDAWKLKVPMGVSTETQISAVHLHLTLPGVLNIDIHRLPKGRHGRLIDIHRSISGRRQVLSRSLQVRTVVGNNYVLGHITGPKT